MDGEQRMLFDIQDRSRIEADIRKNSLRSDGYPLSSVCADKHTSTQSILDDSKLDYSRKIFSMDINNTSYKISYISLAEQDDRAMRRVVQTALSRVASESI